MRALHYRSTEVVRIATPSSRRLILRNVLGLPGSDIDLHPTLRRLKLRAMAGQSIGSSLLAVLWPCPPGWNLPVLRSIPGREVECRRRHASMDISDLPTSRCWRNGWGDGTITTRGSCLSNVGWSRHAARTRLDGVVYDVYHLHSAVDV